MPIVMPGGATLQAAEIHRVWDLFVLAGIGVAGTTYLLILWSIFRYRRRGDALPPQFRQHRVAEVIFTLLPLLIVGWLFWLSYAGEVAVERQDAAPAVRVRVTAFQWSWRFEYAGGPTVTGTPERPPVLTLPVGAPVRLEMQAADVAHSFFVPAFLFKRDAIPGLVSSFDLTITQTGAYRGECAEFCGLDHAVMNFTVSAVPRQAFDDWLRRARAAAAPR